jgi:hypothetical protein
MSEASKLCGIIQAARIDGEPVVALRPRGIGRPGSSRKAAASLPGGMTRAESGGVKYVGATRVACYLEVLLPALGSSARTMLEPSWWRGTGGRPC